VLLVERLCAHRESNCLFNRKLALTIGLTIRYYYSVVDYRNCFRNLDDAIDIPFDFFQSSSNGLQRRYD
jgi:hypothetical protein